MIDDTCCADLGVMNGASSMLRLRLGHTAINVPTSNIGPASHIHHTNGLTIIRNATLLSSKNSWGIIYRSSIGVERIADLVDDILKDG